MPSSDKLYQLRVTFLVFHFNTYYLHQKELKVIIGCKILTNTNYYDFQQNLLKPMIKLW